MKEIDKIAYLRTEGGKILSTKSKGKSVYYIPGGKREEGESDEETLIREIDEELSVQIKPNTIKYVDTFRAQADGKEKGVIVKMTCYQADYEGELRPSHEIEEIKWLNYKDLDIVAAVDKIIFKYLFDKGELE